MTFIRGAGGAGRVARLSIPLALVLAAIGVLGWSAWDADRSRREAAWHTVGDYADFSASLFAANAEALLGPTLLYAFYQAELAERQGAWEPVPPEALASNRPEAGRCRSHYPGGRWFARLSPGAGELDAVGPLPPEEGEWLAGALGERVAGARPEGSPVGLLFPPGEEGTPVVAYRIRRAPDGSVLEAHALAHCFETREGPVFPLAAGQGTLLPPALVGERPADSLMAITVTSTAGDTLFRSERSYPDGIRGRRPPAVGGALDGLEVTVRLRPELADALVVGGIPPSRLPWMIGLLALTALLITATALQLGRAIKLVRLRERFVADVSHELRTPLQQILIFVQLFRMGHLPEEEERATALTVVERETLRLIRMVERILVFARGGQAPGPDPPAEVVDVSRLAGSLVRELTPVAALEGATLRIDAPGDGPWVSAAPETIRQVVVNLVENALKYGPRGQCVTVRVEDRGDRAVLAVEDEGPGVPPRDRERVWDAFYRLEREERAASTGSGIGLSIVRRLVKAAGGTTGIEDAPGGGARVVVSLPITPERPSAAPAEAGERRPTREAV